MCTKRRSARRLTIWRDKECRPRSEQVFGCFGGPFVANMSRNPTFVSPFHRSHCLAAAAQAGKAKLTHPGKAILAGKDTFIHLSLCRLLILLHNSGSVHYSVLLRCNNANHCHCDNTIYNTGLYFYFCSGSQFVARYFDTIACLLYRACHGRQRELC